ncbi:hypothetical protein NMG60_11014752 [Bertholletia excelsa]
MEGDGETMNVSQPSPQALESSNMEEKLLETVEVSNTEQCDFVPESFPELGDSQLPGIESMGEPRDEESMAEQEISVEATGLQTRVDGLAVPEFDRLPIDGAKSPVEIKDEEAVVDISTAGPGVEMKAEAFVAEGGVENSGLELHDAQLVSDELVNSGKDVETGATESIPNVGIETEMRPEEQVESSCGTFDDSKLGGTESLVAVTDGETVTETAGAQMEAEIVAGVVSPTVENVAAQEMPRADTEVGADEKVETIESGETKLVSELDNSDIPDSDSIADKVDENEEVMADEETDMQDVMVETEMANEPQSHQVGAETSSVARVMDDDEDLVADEDIPMGDTEMEAELVEMVEVEKGVAIGGKRKRGGRNSKVSARASSKKAIEEDVCFICFDGGDLVLCDRRGCPKVYHPSCVNRDEAFFRAKGRWNCGWHICSLCQKNAYYMCYTCTFSLCKACTRDAVIFCVRGNKGFCETCMKTVMLIENNEGATKEDRVDFDDKSSWEYLFKDYWTDLKAKLSLSLAELSQAKNPWKGSDAVAGKPESPEELADANNDQGSGSDSSEDPEANKQKRRKIRKRVKSLAKKEDSAATETTGAEVASTPGNTEWASKELLEFVMHMKNGDKSVLSQFDVQALLLEYIKRNKLRDPRRKSQIICDARLENLFGKARVGHFEMLKLLESHFLLKEDSQTDEIEGTVVDTEVNQSEGDGIMDAPIKGSKERKRKARKKGDERGPQSNLDDYAAIDMHNINLIYLRRKLVEDLLEDNEKFHDKVVGTFVRIRISGSNQKQDIYRLVQVVGTRTADAPYKVGKKTTDLVLEILNLNKTEIVSMDTISNQEFTEDECKRLRQSIKCGLINRLTVGDILDKAMEVQAARVNDWLETETVRLSHLRDRASEKGRRKELRECVEKLQLLKTPEERRRRLEEVPEIHADPNMDPSYESEEDGDEMEEEKQEIYARPRGSGFSRKGMDPVSPRKASYSISDSWSVARSNSGKNWEFNRNISSKDFSNKAEEAASVGEIQNENAWNRGRDKEMQTDITEKANSAAISDAVGRSNLPFVRSESHTVSASEITQASLSAGVTESANKINESEKIWHYQDPSGKVQGPFSMVQLRKWSNNGYFPADLRIWKMTERQDDSILLTDALAGRFHKELLPMTTSLAKAQSAPGPHFSSSLNGKPSGGEGMERSIDQSRSLLAQLDLSSSTGRGTTSVEVPKQSADMLGSDYSRNEPISLPSPTPKSNTPGWRGVRSSESKWSSSSLPVQQASSVLGLMQSPAIATSDGQATLSSTPSSIHHGGNKEHNSALESIDISAIASVLKSSGRQLISGLENDTSSSSTSSNLPPNSEQGIHPGSITAQPPSQTAMAGETHGWGSSPVQRQEMLAPQAPQSDSRAWTATASHQPNQPNPSIPVPVQPSPYNQWAGIPSTVQNPAGNYSTPGFSAVPQPDPWRPPVPANQSNIPPAAPPMVPWGMSPTPNTAFPLGPRPENANTGWVPIQGNPNMGWGGPTPPAPNVNWGATIPGTVNPAWVAPHGNPGQGFPPGNANPGWPAQTGNQCPPPVSGNPGWVAPMGNPGANPQAPAQANMNPVWVTPAGNQGQGPVPGNANPVYPGPGPASGSANPGYPGPGQGPAPANANPSWGGPPPGNLGQRDRGSWGQDSDYGGGRPRGRPWGQDSDNSMCRFYLSGHCRKGSRCSHPHS